MKTLLRLGLPLLAVLSLASLGCRTSPGNADSSWNVDSVPTRMVSAFSGGYREDLDGSYRDFEYQKKKDINLTLRRHFLNNNPYNPNEPDDPYFFAPRPPVSLFPDPVMYFHVESIAFGLVFLGASGTFIPLPVDSLVATFLPGGFEEFGQGWDVMFSGSFGSDPLDVPPASSKFRVRTK